MKHQVINKLNNAGIICRGYIMPHKFLSPKEKDFIVKLFGHNIVSSNAF